MNKTIIKINGYLKAIVFAARPHILLGWLRGPLSVAANTLSLTKWMAAQDRKNTFNDFVIFNRNYFKRYKLYEHIIGKYNLATDAVEYYEFGVAGGHSFKWWIEQCKNTDSRFYGFDTFEGLPEDWGTFDKGHFAHTIPEINVQDKRAELVKGLFQDSLPGFIASRDMKSNRRKLIHLDADIFSATLYALTAMAPYMRKGDLLMFDEFNVPNHEFLAFKIFCDSYYIKTKLVGAVNNYLQVAFVVE